MSTPKRPPTTADYPTTSLRIVCIVANLLLFALWLWLYWPVMDYLAVIFSREDFRTNQVLLLGVVGLIVMQVRQGGIRVRFDALPRLYIPALAVMLAGSLIYLLSERFLDVNTLAASCFALASYGLLGLWMGARRWRQGLPALLLLIGTLPFGEHMQTFIGYPMRILTAALVQDGLAMANVASVGVDTILVLENGVSKIDSPCSGVKSLWTGMLFLISATWIERKRLNLRWLLIAFFFIGLLFVANVTRVGILVVVGEVQGWRVLAEMLHVPLGVLGFVGACAAAVLLLRTQRSIDEDRWQADTVAGPNSPLEPRHQLGHQRAIWLTPALAAIIALMALLYTPRPQSGLAHPAPEWSFETNLLTEAMPLKPDEVEWLTRDGAESADRRRFEWRGIRGSMILITSTTWRAHHRPERCFEVYGLTLNESRTHLVNDQLAVRFVSLGDKRHTLSATYWFQSAERTTDDYGTRIWADLSPQPSRWVLVSILFDDVYDPDEKEIEAFYLALHEAVAQQLN